MTEPTEPQPAAYPASVTALIEAGDAALTDFISIAGSDFDRDAFPGMAWLEHELEDWERFIAWRERE